MTWLTWRQTRASILAVTAAALLVAAALALSGPDLVHRYRTQGEAFIPELTLDNLFQVLFQAGVAFLYAAPAVVGVFWGAPMVARELEAGTHKLVWTQGVSRTRWLAAKLGLTALVTALVSGTVALAATWWADPIQRAVFRDNAESIFALPRIHPVIFGGRGFVPVAYALLALALGTALGMVVRRTVFAMGLTLVVVVALQIVMPSVVRAHLMPTENVLIPITEDNVHGLRGSPPPRGSAPGAPAVIETFNISTSSTGAWRLSDRTVKDGVAPAALPAWVEDCLVHGPRSEESPQERQRRGDVCFARLAAEGYRQQVVAHPDAHFWPLQWRESGLLLALAGLATGFCFWRVRRDFA